jgi:hypothetical protein
MLELRGFESKIWDERNQQFTWKNPRDEGQQIVIQKNNRTGGYTIWESLGASRANDGRYQRELLKNLGRDHPALQPDEQLSPPPTYRRS